MSGRMPSCKEPEAFDLGVALWHFLPVSAWLTPVSLAWKAQVSIPELLPISLLVTFFLLASTSPSPAAQKAGHTPVTFAHSQELVLGCLSPLHQPCVHCSSFSWGWGASWYHRLGTRLRVCRTQLCQQCVQLQGCPWAPIFLWGLNQSGPRGLLRHSSHTTHPILPFQLRTQIPVRFSIKFKCQCFSLNLPFPGHLLWTRPYAKGLKIFVWITSALLWRTSQMKNKNI